MIPALFVLSPPKTAEGQLRHLVRKAAINARVALVHETWTGISSSETRKIHRRKGDDNVRLPDELRYCPTGVEKEKMHIPAVPGVEDARIQRKEILISPSTKAPYRAPLSAETAALLQGVYQEDRWNHRDLATYWHRAEASGAIPSGPELITHLWSSLDEEEKGQLFLHHPIVFLLQYMKQTCGQPPALFTVRWLKTQPMRVPWELRRLQAALDKADHKVAALAEAHEKDSIFNWVLLHRV
uniref:Uncharacterized protein n=1 Tax=Chromera velia CCMP2878 TaxID=1169474 RepID=A0A0G4HQ86_9ALVE|eukprot:Cvel_30060.t1-p1 / transcript=Cvel_30060.t1 / gene=Cvel_30060 / organism=Chromera_velia_CCMP2878 / gene_product=hypothetical protein / transcript_product=hypothetical protein / location=Cvel_scaffold4228:7299-8018(+) / protein_length=240 / sequence_SO=supercontig / SO=protein_coding / is_pseudo=false